MGNRERTVVLSFPNAIDLGKSIASILGVKHLVVNHKVFPDGESYIKIPDDISDNHVVLIQRLYPDQDKRLIELILTVDALKFHKASSVSLVIPYLAYARQDREFLPGEAVSVRAILRMLHGAGADKLIVVDIHKPESLRYFNGKSYNILPVRTWHKCISSMHLSNPIVIAPDVGASKRAELLSASLGCDYVVIRKTRDRITGEIKHELPSTLSVKGRDAIIVDDIISTGGTMANITKYLVRSGAGKVYAVASHGIFVGNALNKLRNAGLARIIVLNTIITSNTHDFVKYCDISSELASAVERKILNE